MATSRPFAYNTGSTLPFTEQVGDIAIGTGGVEYAANYGGLKWWGGPDEDLGYVITHTVPDGNQPNPLNIPAYLGFWRSPLKTESSFVDYTNFIFGTSFTTGNECKTYLNDNGYWTSWVELTPTPTPTPTPNIVTSGLIMQLDANETDSYPGSGTTIFDLTGSFNNTLSGGATFTTLNGVKCFDCTTGTESVQVSSTGPSLPTTGYTYVTWARIIPSSTDWRSLLRTNNNVPILVQIGTDDLGYYGSGSILFQDSGYNVTSDEDVWVQYAVVGDSTSSIFYINGTQVGTVAYGAGGDTHFGWGNNQLAGQPFGYLANLYFYNRKLSFSEINQMYDFLSPNFVEPTPTPTVTPTPTPTPTEPFFILIQNGNILTAQDGRGIEYQH